MPLQLLNHSDAFCAQRWLELAGSRARIQHRARADFVKHLFEHLPRSKQNLKSSEYWVKRTVPRYGITRVIGTARFVHGNSGGTGLLSVRFHFLCPRRLIFVPACLISKILRRGQTVGGGNRAAHATPTEEGMQRARRNSVFVGTARRILKAPELHCHPTRRAIEFVLPMTLEN